MRVGTSVASLTVMSELPADQRFHHPSQPCPHRSLYISPCPACITCLRSRSTTFGRCPGDHRTEPAYRAPSSPQLACAVRHQRDLRDPGPFHRHYKRMSGFNIEPRQGHWGEQGRSPSGTPRSLPAALAATTSGSLHLGRNLPPCNPCGS